MAVHAADDDPQIASELDNIAARKRTMSVDIETLERQLADGQRAITPEILDRFGTLIAWRDACAGSSTETAAYSPAHRQDGG